MSGNPFGVGTPFHLTPEFLAAVKSFNESTAAAVDENRRRPREAMRDAYWGGKADDQ